MSMGKTIATVAAGALFGFGLALSTMIRPEVVLSFLQFRDWGLALVMGRPAGFEPPRRQEHKVISQYSD